jgi:hypothetical protein
MAECNQSRELVSATAKATGLAGLNTVGQVCGSKALPACAQANAQGVMPSLLSPGRSPADPAMAMKQQSARLSLF